MRRLRRALLWLPLLALAACGSDEPPPPPPPPPAPTVVSLTLKASPGVNPDAQGQAKPLHVRILKLASGVDFVAADFFALDQGLDKELGSDLKGSADFVLAPGATEVWQAKLDDDTRVIGVMAAYQAIDTAQWRAWKEIPRNATTLLTAEFGPKGVELREAAP